jgi:predicted MPP superfamily phosphohydrolase
MRRRTLFSVFFLMFLTLSLTMHYYIFSHLWFMLDVDRTAWFWVFIGFSSVSWLLAMGLEMFVANGGSRVFSIGASLWLGTLFMFLFTLIAYDIIRFSVDIDTTYAGPAVISFVGSVVAFGVMNARFLRVREVDVPTKKLNGGLRLVHLTDLHIGAIYGPRHLQRIVDRVNALEPDMVLITGDLADGPHTYTEESFAPIDDIQAPVYFSLGNHEGFADLNKVLPLFDGTKMRILRNEMETVGDVQIVGVDDHWDKGIVPKVLDDVRPDPSKYTILMYHRPVSWREARERGVDLMLAGHTHAGQFYPFNLLVRAIWRKVKGLYDLGGMYLYAGTGTGTWGPPMRVGTNSEVALLRINGREGPPASVG